MLKLMVQPGTQVQIGEMTYRFLLVHGRLYISDGEKADPVYPTTPIRYGVMRQLSEGRKKIQVGFDVPSDIQIRAS